MRGGHQPAQVQPQPDPAGRAHPRGIGPVERLAQVPELCRVDPGAVVAHRQPDLAVHRQCLHLHRPARAMAQRVVQQVAQQQAQAGAVQRQQWQALGQRQGDAAASVVGGQLLAHQRVQVGGFTLQHSRTGGQALALQQVADQVAHLAQVAQQRQPLGAFGQQLGMQPGAGQRRAQFVTDRQQQAALVFQHVLQAGRHGVDLGRQLAQFVGPAPRDGLRKITRSVAQRARVNVFERPQQAPRVSVGASGQRQQGGQREPAKTTRTLVARPVADAEADAVAVGGAALQQAAPVGLTRKKTGKLLISLELASWEA